MKLNVILTCPVCKGIADAIIDSNQNNEMINCVCSDCNYKFNYNFLINQIEENK